MAITALAGFAGVLMRNIVFTAAEALRFGTVSAAVHDRGSVVGLWRLTDALMACFSSATPGTVGGAGRFGLAGLVAAFGWGVWIVPYSVVLLGV
ncbi:hypothetical protein ACWEPC_14405 [Nonomuraea sp. NPDC004297]